MEKYIITLFCTLTFNNLFCQTLKNFNGQFNDGRLQNGNATYTYYEDPNTHEYLKQGAFKYTFKGQGDYVGYDQTITGSFDKGLKTGTWSYIITMTDFGSRNPFATGTVSLIANYKNGYADGNWKEIRSYKNRKKYLVNGQYNWEPFEPLKTMIINLNFSNGKLAGAVNINDEFANFKAVGNYDNNSLCNGTWIINDMGWGKNKELIYKDNILYEFIARSNSGEVESGTTKYQTDYDNYLKAKSMTSTEREDAGLAIDTICGGDLCAATNNIKEYFPKLLSADYFLYEFIGGDLSFKEGFRGGCDLQVKVKNYNALSSDEDFKNAEVFYKEKDLLRANELYKKIDLTKIKPSERKNVTDKVASINPMIDDLIKMYQSNSKFMEEFTKTQYDSLEQDKIFYSKYISLKMVDLPGTGAVATHTNGENYRAISRNQYSQEIECTKPWENRSWQDASNCFYGIHRGLYTTTQYIVTEEFFKYQMTLETEEANIKKSIYSFRIDNAYTEFYTYDKKTFLDNIAAGRKKYNLSKSFVELIFKNLQIENLNDQNKKKTLFSKYKLVYKNFNTLLESNTELQSIADNLNKLNLFLDKVIVLYARDTKDLEKQLKDTETVEQIQTLILNN